MKAWWNGMLVSLGFRRSEEEKLADELAAEDFRYLRQKQQERIARMQSLRYAVYKDGERIAVGKRYTEKEGVLTLFHDDDTHSVFARHAWDMVIQEER